MVKVSCTIETVTPPDRKLRASCVYIIAAGNPGPVKIGHAFDPIKRLEQLQTANPTSLRLVRAFIGGEAEEAWFHRRFSKQRIRGEWFNWHPLMMFILPPGYQRRAA